MFITIRKRSIITVVVLLVLSISTYLNFKMPFEKNATIAVSDSAGEEVKTGDAIMVSTKIDAIIEARNNRAVVRSKACDLLTKTIKDTSASSDAKQKAENMILDMAEAIDAENECESLLEAKGFGECVVFISDKNVNVTISKKEVTDVDAAKINDIVSSVTNIKQIKIINVG